jgi:hypothetical protein
VRDLEIALVLAREMKAAAARSVDASLRLDQLQEVFGVEELDRAERARIQTALQMAGLEPFPSLLEADPSEPIRFGAAKVATAAGAGTAAPPSGELPAADEPPAEAPPTFPTVGQFARSKFGRSRRARRGDNDHGAGHAPPPAPPEPESAPEEALEEAAAEPGMTHVHDEVTEPEASAAAPEPELEAEPEPEPEPQTPPEPEAAGEPMTEMEPEPELEASPQPEAEDEREYIPLVPPEEVEPPATGYGTLQPEPEPEPAPVEPARSDDLVVALLPAVAIPVIVTSIAGWRFGLTFVALSVIATGVLRGRRSSVGVVLMTTMVLTVVSVAASVLLASVGKSDSKTPSAGKTITPPKAVTSTPTTPAPAPRKQHKKRPPTKLHAPVPDPGTEGLVRVPPKSSTTPPTATTPAPQTQTTP